MVPDLQVGTNVLTLKRHKVLELLEHNINYGYRTQVNKRNKMPKASHTIENSLLRVLCFNFRSPLHLGRHPIRAKAWHPWDNQTVHRSSINGNFCFLHQRHSKLLRLTRYGTSSPKWLARQTTELEGSRSNPCCRKLIGQFIQRYLEE